MSQKRARLQEVADRAQVAFITAWRALNAPDLVSDKTRDKVRAAAEDLGYVPNMVARSLVSATSWAVGVIVPTLYDSIFADTVQGVADVVRPAGVELLIGLSDYDREREAEIIKAFIGRQIDGLVLTGRDHTDAANKLLRASRLPIVETWDFGDAAVDMQVGFSSFAMAEAVTEFLIAKGYRRIAFVGPAARHRGIERRRGYRAALANHDLPADDTLVVDATPDLDGGAAAFNQLLALPSPPDAIFLNGDAMAIGAHLAGTARGLCFPDDMALIGVHDSALADRLTPRLSSVRIPRYQMGARAAELLLARADATTTDGNIDLRFEIIDRATT